MNPNADESKYKIKVCRLDVYCAIVLNLFQVQPNHQYHSIPFLVTYVIISGLGGSFNLT